MMNFFSSWAEQIIMAVVICSIIEMILPDNKNKRYVKMIMGIYILFNIISPIINKNDLLSFENLNIESLTTSSENIVPKELNQQSMDERLKQLYIEELQNNIKEKAQEEGYNVYSCKVDAVITGDEKNQGINKISLVISKDIQSNEKEDNDNSNIKSVDKINIKVGLNKYFDEEQSDDNDKYSSKDINKLKKALSEHYEIEEEKIKISLK